LNERIVLRDLLPLGHEPARDLSLGQALTEVRKLELVAHAPSIAWTPFVTLTICVTCRSTDTLASASASLRAIGERSSMSLTSSVSLARSSGHSIAVPETSPSPCAP